MFLPSLSNLISKSLKFLFLELVAHQMLIMIIDKRERSSGLTQRKPGGSQKLGSFPLLEKSLCLALCQRLEA